MTEESSYWGVGFNVNNFFVYSFDASLSSSSTDSKFFRISLRKSDREREIEDNKYEYQKEIMLLCLKRCLQFSSSASIFLSISKNCMKFSPVETKPYVIPPIQHINTTTWNCLIDIIIRFNSRAQYLPVLLRCRRFSLSTLTIGFCLKKLVLGLENYKLKNLSQITQIRNSSASNQTTLRSFSWNDGFVRGLCVVGCAEDI
jgi:hypothetical protein